MRPLYAKLICLQVYSKCIRKLFNPVNFIGRISELDKYIVDFNQYLAFDKWLVTRNETEILFKKVEKISLYDERIEEKEDSFLDKEFNNISLDNLGIETTIANVLKIRFEEIKKCFFANAHLSVITLAGSTLEGILLGTAQSNPKDFNQANGSPKSKEGKVKPFQDWSLSQLIEVANELGLLQEEVRKFSSVLRDFRNYIHPYEQVCTGFFPDEHTAKICWQVLRAAIYQLNKNRKISS